MLLSSNISLLFHKKENNNIPYKVNPDIYYFPNIKAHLEQNANYRAERREWAKTQPTKHVAWCLFRIKDEFCIKYLIPFHEDIDKFVSYYPGALSREIAEKFCKSWKLYNDVFGIDFVERAIVLSMWRNPEISSIEFETENLISENTLTRNYTTYEMECLQLPFNILSPGSILHLKIE